MRYGQSGTAPRTGMTNRNDDPDWPYRWAKWIAQITKPTLPLAMLTE